MEITWLGILAIAILIFTGYGGYRKGFVREIMSFFFVFLAKEALRKFDAACGNRPKEEKEETPEKKKKGGWEKFKETIKETFED